MPRLFLLGLAFSADSALLATVDNGSHLRLWPLPTPPPFRVIHWTVK